MKSYLKTEQAALKKPLLPRLSIDCLPITAPNYVTNVEEINDTRFKHTFITLGQIDYSVCEQEDAKSRQTQEIPQRL